MERFRLSSSHVRVGVPLPGNVYDEGGHLLLSKGQVLESEAQLENLMGRGMYVDLSVFEAHFRGASAPAPKPQEKFDPFLVRNSLKLGLNRLLHAIGDGTGSPAQVSEFARNLGDFVQADVEAAIATCFLERSEESRAITHSLSVAMLCCLLVRRLEWEEARQCSVVCAALTMNLGMLDLQQRLSRQSTPLSPPQRQQVHVHGEESVKALKAIGVDDGAWLTAVRQHHEKPGGMGYPRKQPEPHEVGQLVRLLDVLVARASPRGDRPPLHPAQIVRSLFGEEGKGPCAPLLGSVLKVVGAYPPGCFVKLVNGEAAVVFRQGETPNAPIVAAITNTSGVPIMQPVRRDTSRQTMTIASPYVPEKLPAAYDLGKLWVTNAHH